MMAIVVSEHEKIRSRITKMLQDFAVIDCETFLDAVSSVSRYINECGIVIADYNISPFNGIDFLDLVKQMNESIVSVLLIDGTNDDVEIEGLESGVDLIIDHNKSEEVIMAHVNKFEMALKEKSTKFSISNEGLSINDVYIRLTRKERDIVSVLLDGKGMPVTRDEIIKKVWKFAEKNNARAVDIHIKAIRSKLSMNGFSDYIDTVSGVGYRWNYES